MEKMQVEDFKQYFVFQTSTSNFKLLMQSCKKITIVINFVLLCLYSQVF